MLHFNRLRLQFLFVILVSTTSICNSSNGSCKAVGCLKRYNKQLSCQCNAKCLSYRNCCNDYNDTCGSCKVIGCGKPLNRSLPCQCNEPCRGFNDCCSDYNDTCDLSQGTNILAIVVAVGTVITVMVIIVILIFGLKLRKQRAQRVSNEVDDRHYYEIVTLNEQSFGGPPSAAPNTDKWKSDITGLSPTLPPDRCGSGKVIRNVAYERYSLKTKEECVY